VRSHDFAESGRLSVAGMAFLKADELGRFFYRVHVRRRRKGDRPSLSEADYARLVTAAHRTPVSHHHRLGHHAGAGSPTHPRWRPESRSVNRAGSACADKEPAALLMGVVQMESSHSLHRVFIRFAMHYLHNAR
jgi:hypothetical protein